MSKRKLSGIGTGDRPRRWSLLIAACAVAYLLVGLYPYHLTNLFVYQENQARRLDTGDLIFTAPGVALTDRALPWLAEVRAAGDLRVLLGVTSLLPVQDGPARIFSISGGTNARNLTLGQQGTDLSIRLRTPRSSANGMPEIIIPAVFARPVSREILLQVREAQLTVAVDGVQRIDQPLPESPLSNWDDSFVLVFGNEVTGDRPWLGVVHQARIGSAQQELFQLGDPLVLPEGHLLVPDRTRQLQANALRLSGSGATYYQDRVINLLGFIPFGMLLAWRRTISLWKVLAFAACLSLSIECGQLLVESRHPSVMDVVMNALGGLLGALLVRRRRTPAVNSGVSRGPAG